MSQIAIFTFNPFQENTYVIYDDTQECVIIDPGCYTQAERDALTSFIEGKQLQPVAIWLTHAHIDHVLGNWFVADRYNIGIAMHPSERDMLAAMPAYGRASYGVIMQPSPAPTQLLAANQEISFGNTSFKCLFVPGHSPASLAFYNEAEQYVIAGDVLFKGSIGRTDLTGGDMNTLLNSIQTQLFTLDDAVKVYPGHYDDTTIGDEKRHNPFFQ